MRESLPRWGRKSAKRVPLLLLNLQAAPDAHSKPKGCKLYPQVDVLETEDGRCEVVAYRVNVWRKNTLEKEVAFREPAADFLAAHLRAAELNRMRETHEGTVCSPYGA